MLRILHAFSLSGALEAVCASRFSNDDVRGVGQFEPCPAIAIADMMVVDPVGRPLAWGHRFDRSMYGAFRNEAPDDWGRLMAAKERARDATELKETDLLDDDGALWLAKFLACDDTFDNARA